MKKAFITAISILTVIICVMLVIGLPGDDSYVGKGQTLLVASNDWNVAYAGYVNSSGIKIIADGESKNALMPRDVYMNDARELMLSAELIRQLFDCAVNIYDDGELVIASDRYRVIAQAGSSHTEVQSLSDESRTGTVLDNCPEIKDGEVFIPADLLVKCLGFSYAWNQDSMTAVFENDDTDISSIKYFYSNAEYGKLTDVKNQENLGVCWAFASVSALESTLLPAETWDFSEDHMIYNNPGGTGGTDGGDFLAALAYLTSWKGPVREEDDPFNDGWSDPSLEAVKHVQEVHFLKSKDYEAIKKMVFKYGAVETSLHIALEKENYVSPEYFDYTTNGYCYDGNAEANHEVVIVGWDDDFPAGQLGGHAVSNGAFICRNSWGSSFGDNGIFYVAYDDAVIGTRSEVYTRIEEPDNYDNIYQWDSNGWNASIGYGRNKAYAATVFTSEEDQALKAVSLIATGADTSYKIYICHDFEDAGSISLKQEPCASGVFSDAGYYTVDLDREVRLSQGERFAIVAELITVGSSRPIAVNIPVNAEETNSFPAAGESYISNYGNEWENTQEKNNCSVCIKAFTDIR